RACVAGASICIVRIEVVSKAQMSGQFVFVLGFAMVDSDNRLALAITRRSAIERSVHRQTSRLLPDRSFDLTGTWMSRNHPAINFCRARKQLTLRVRRRDMQRLADRSHRAC